MNEVRRTVAIIAGLAIVLLGAVFGYRVLSQQMQEVPASSLQTEAAPEASSSAAPSGAASSSSVAAEPEVFMLPDYDATVYNDLGESVLLSELGQGKPLVINFWATWCPYCVEEMPSFQEIVREYGDSVAFAFVDVCDGQRETEEMAKTWLQENGLSDLPAYYDRDLAAVRAIGIRSYPTTVIVGANNEILTVSPGKIDPTLMRGALNTLVG